MPTLKPFTPPKRPRLPAAGISTSCGCLPEGKLRGHSTISRFRCGQRMSVLFFLSFLPPYLLCVKTNKIPRKSHLPGLGIYFSRPEKHPFPGRKFTQFSLKNHYILWFNPCAFLPNHNSASLLPPRHSPSPETYPPHKPSPPYILSPAAPPNPSPNWSVYRKYRPSAAHYSG